MEEKKFLDKNGLYRLITLVNDSISKKLDTDKLVALSIDEYNALGDDINDDTFYFIIDKDDNIFDKIMEIYDLIDGLKTEIKVAQDFKNQFPIDNRTYGIINQQPKNLSEVFPDELGIPTDQNGVSENDQTE